MKKYLTPLLALFLGLQLVVLLGEYLNSIYPRWYGEEVLLEIEPVDPRSMFRGQYVRLDYTISEVKFDEFNGLSSEEFEQIRKGEIVYVGIREALESHPESDERFWEVSGAYLEVPETGQYIKGRMVRRRSRDDNKSLELKYGIEAFFASPAKALELEKKARGRDGGNFARVMIAPNGKAALVDLVFPEKS